MASPSIATIPQSDSTVDVSIINTEAFVGKVKVGIMMHGGPIGKHEYLSCPCYSFLIHHKPSNTRWVFDLGIRKDVENHAPTIWKPIKEAGWEIRAPTDVAEILGSHNVPLDSINSIIWSHHHFDHMGDPSTFPKSTSLIVGPGFKKEHLPPYPENPDGRITSDIIADREMHELDFSGPNAMKLGPYTAIDYFKDGSFYFLDTPGHTVGHISALARTTAGARSTFIFMGGDIAHHAGEFRPSPEMPLPEKIKPDPRYPPYHALGAGAFCPGSLVTALHPFKNEDPHTSSFYKTSGAHDEALAQETVDGMPKFDGSNDVLTVIAHDQTIFDVVKFFPESANQWKAKGWKTEGHWRFLGDFI